LSEKEVLIVGVQCIGSLLADFHSRRSYFIVALNLPIPDYMTDIYF